MSSGGLGMDGTIDQNMVQYVYEKISAIIGQEMKCDTQINLFNHGLDSLRAIQLIVLLEEELGIGFDDDDLLLENFETIEKIVWVIDKKKHLRTEKGVGK